jgi:aminoglycoside phosphotransferase (APT) family kinase protein
VTPVPRQGNDNRTFRLGDELAVRLPSAERYVAGIAKEDAVLPRLAPHLTVPVPVPVATGRPTAEFPHPWSVRRWLAGDTPDRDAGLDRVALARDVGAFLRELRAIPAEDGPPAGRHSFFRGCHPEVYDAEVEDALRRLAGRVDAGSCRAIWQQATSSWWTEAGVWFHGDVAVGNLLTSGGRLAAVIDFGTCGVGDPACDVVLAWTFFDARERQVFREAAGLPRDVWDRGRAWALWKALITLAGDAVPDPSQVHALTELLAEAP